MARRRRQPGNRPTKPVFVVACEDSKSAPAYFKALFRLFSETVTLKLATRNTNRTSPPQVVDRVVKCRDSLEKYTDPPDQAWAVFDSEPQAGEAYATKIDDAIKRAQQQSVRTAISNPCFEHWLHLHLKEYDGGHESANDAGVAFAKQWKKSFDSEYKKGSADFSKLITENNVMSACDRAKRQLKRQNGNAPHKCSPCVTDVYKLVQELQKVSPKEKV